MKINGIKFDGPAEDILVIPMCTKGEMVFKIRCVTNYADFEKMVKEPTPPLIMRRGQTTALPNYDDAGYKKKVTEYITKQTHYMILKSLETTDGLEWDSVNINDPDTWGNYEKELKAAGLGDIHIGKIVRSISEVNGLSEAKMEEAKQRFLALQLLQKDLSSQQGEALSTPSGEVAKD